MSLMPRYLDTDALYAWSPATSVAKYCPRAACAAGRRWRALCTDSTSKGSGNLVRVGVAVWLGGWGWGHD
eukprot:scaffold11175_cov63-Phaeocystis_antarctica.AAC.6